MRPSVKFCGLTRTEDVQTAAALGVDAVGLVFYPPSLRHVDRTVAQRLALSVPAFVSVVALVVNVSQDELTELADTISFDIIQFHGDETPQACAALAKSVHKRWIKAIRVQDDWQTSDILTQIDTLKAYGASGVILDAYHPKQYGGTGEQFDWSKIPDNSPLPIYLAGGLTPDNIGQITSNPKLIHKIAGVDVSGGIERAKGVKCGERMRAFISNMTHQ